MNNENKRKFGKEKSSQPSNSNLGKGTKNRDFEKAANKGSEDSEINKSKDDSLLDDNKNKDSKKPNLIGDSESSEIDSDVQLFDELKEKLAKATKRKINGCLIAIGVGIVMFVLVIGLLMKIVEPITALVDGVINAGVAVVNAAQNFFEKAKNLFVHGYFSSNEKTLYEKIRSKEQTFFIKHGRHLNIPLVSATLYYDGDPSDKREFETEDGKVIEVDRISNEKLNVRIKYLDDVIERMFAIREYKYRCDYKMVEAGKGSYELTLVSEQHVIEEDKSKTGRTCDENHLTGESKSDDAFIFVYKEVYDELGFAYRLKNDLMSDGRTLVEHIFPEKYKEIGSVDPIIQDIINYYEVWILLYGKPQLSGDCYFPGSLSEDVIGSFSPPLKGGYRITSRFGIRPNPFGDKSKPPEQHNGIDLVPTGGDRNIYAVADGVVTTNMFYGNAGNYVTLMHQIGGTTYYTQYMHMIELSHVRVGQSISQGEAIGVVGSTGRSTGPHLHFAVYTKEGGKEYKDPENLLSGAENYNYDCEEPQDELVRSCSVEGAVAMYALDNKKSFNLIRAILDEYKNRLLLLDFDIPTIMNLYDADKSKTQIYFDNMTIDIDGRLLSFSDPFRDHSARTKLIESIGEYNPSVYEMIKIGFSNFPSSLYSQYGYTTAKEMYEVFNNNTAEYVDNIFDYITKSDSYVDEIFNTIETTEGATYTVLPGETIESISNKLGVTSLTLLAEGESNGNIVSGRKIRINNRAAISGVLKAIYSKIPEESDFNRFEKDPTYVARIVSVYEGFYSNSFSTIENYIDQCLHVPKPDWEDCVTWENKENCKANLKNNRAAANYYLKNASSVAGKKVLAYGLSLWGKVRYCGACDLSNPECNFINPNTGKIGTDAHKYSYSGIRCSPWARSWGEGFNPKWKELHTYYFPGIPFYRNKNDLEKNIVSYKSGGGTFTAALAGLDCDGFVNWVLKHAFNDFSKNAFPVMGAVCNGETNYTYATQFKNVEGFTGKNFGDTILPVLKPGDVICNSTSEKFGSASEKADPTWNYAGGSRHVMFYMGFEDVNGNLYADSGDYIYVLHSSTYGVRVDKVPANSKDWFQYSSFASYK